MKSLENLNYPYLSRANIFTKVRVCWTDLMDCPYYSGLIFFLKTTVLMMSLKNLNWPYYHGLTFSWKWEFCWTDLINCPYYSGLIFFFQNDSFDDVTEKFEVALLSRAEFFLKNILYEVTWIFALLGFPRSKISTSKIFDMLLLSPEETFVKIKQLWWSHLKFEPPLLSWAETF